MNRLPKIFVLSMLFLVNNPTVNAADKKNTVTLEQASEMVRKQSKGKVLSARTTNFNGGRTHRIQVLTPSGRVKIFQVPVNKDKFKNLQLHKPRYSQDQINTPINSSSRSNRTNYRTPNSNTTARNNSTSSNGEKKQQ